MIAKLKALFVNLSRGVELPSFGEIKAPVTIPAVATVEALSSIDFFSHLFGK